MKSNCSRGETDITAVFGTAIQGSNPCGGTIKYAGIFYCAPANGKASGLDSVRGTFGGSFPEEEGRLYSAVGNRGFPMREGHERSLCRPEQYDSESG